MNSRKIDVVSDELMIFDRIGDSSVAHCFKSEEGIGSKTSLLEKLMW